MKLTFAPLTPQLLERPSREVRVRAQYDHAQAAADYLRGTYGSRPEGRFQRSRLQLTLKILASHPGGDLLDVGCGPGVMALALLTSRPGDFRITVLDQSLAMIKYCSASTCDSGQINPTVGQVEALPFAAMSFDLALVMGTLEYADARAAVRELSRVIRPGGVLIATMLNPLSPYRLAEWFLFWPFLRFLEAVERCVGVPAERRHGARITGIRAFPAGMLRRLLMQVGLQPIDLVHFDVTPLLPPLDRLRLIARMADRTGSERTVTRGWRRWMGTGYLVVARRM